MNLQELGRLAAALEGQKLAGAGCEPYDGEPEDDPTQVKFYDLAIKFYDPLSSAVLEDHRRVLMHLEGCEHCKSSHLVRHVHSGVTGVDDTVEKMLQEEFESRLDFLRALGLVKRTSNRVRLSHFGKALLRVFRKYGKYPTERDQRADTAFIGSSTEGLPIANKLRDLLRRDLDSVVWDDGPVFGLGESLVESLEDAVHDYDFGIFVFTPDDTVTKRRTRRSVARDNVVFELGLFIGKLSRRRAFLVHPGKQAIALPSDLNGMGAAEYDPDKLPPKIKDATDRQLSAALGPVAGQIRFAVQEVRQDVRAEECA